MPSHDVLTELGDIRRWAEARGGYPAHERNRDGAGLRIVFPNESPADDVERVDWNRFFQIFNDHGLEMIVHDQEALGTRSCFFSFAERSSRSRQATPRGDAAV